MAGRQEKEVKKLLLTVDADDEAVAEAVKGGADMILSHHPLIFKPVRHVSDEDFIGRRLVSMIQADISSFAMHTNYDAAPGCMADQAAERDRDFRRNAVGTHGRACGNPLRHRKNRGA